MLLLFITSCKKDGNFSEKDQVQSIPIADSNTSNFETNFELTVENFFNPIYVRKYLEMPSNRIVVMG